MGNIFGMAFQGAQNIGKMAFSGTKAGVHATFLGVEEALATGSQYMRMTGNRVASETIDTLQGMYGSMLTAELDSPTKVNKYISYLRNTGTDPKNPTDEKLSRIQFSSVADAARFRYGSANGKGGYDYGLMAKDSAKVAGAMTVAGVGVAGINSIVNGD